jgi:hypothetical protein
VPVTPPVLGVPPVPVLPPLLDEPPLPLGLEPPVPVVAVSPL